jgi:hypothetical protein
MYLLHAHILRHHKEAEVVVHRLWPRTELELRDDRLTVELPGYPWTTFDDSKERFFLFDQGQTTHWDTSLWSAFKNLVQGSNKPVYVAIFGGYGIEEPTSVVPLEFPAKVLLDRVYDDEGSRSYGLLLDKEEFYDVLERQNLTGLFADDLCDFIYQLTRGHVGHTLTFVEFLSKKVQICNSRAT